ncbi:hypothetical protein AAZX31_04G118500 [Glycine max]|uniref:Uncharacterized protein n=1 Tax=Glycine max TaxID=3847 RepID=K7KJT7_SOYBN|nr:hypothetical protein JHK87_009767 [Glycine soja]KAG5066175.1 hypothetical protein JHK86_009906 [Glycine max]KAH1111135.1 hypothetical protein GYH30_009763 [Glycine max]KRH62730.1 hypothetical protein GLYMA_04G127200v4 [Glycine max]
MKLSSPACLFSCSSPACLLSHLLRISHLSDISLAPAWRSFAMRKEGFNGTQAKHHIKTLEKGRGKTQGSGPFIP